jgi:hypothetical protein
MIEEAAFDSQLGRKGFLFSIASRPNMRLFQPASNPADIGKRLLENKATGV